jgi:hypothetical protein
LAVGSWQLAVDTQRRHKHSFSLSIGPSITLTNSWFPTNNPS